MPFYLVDPKNTVQGFSHATEISAYDALLQGPGKQPYQVTTQLDDDTKRQLARGLEDHGWSVRWSGDFIPAGQEWPK